MKLVGLILTSACLFAADLPVKGISHVGFRVADLEKTRAFYTGILGFQQAFEQKDASGKTTLAVFKINEDEFLEFAPGAPVGFTHVAFLTDKLQSLRQSVEALGLHPPELRTGRDRTRNFSIKDPDEHRIEFVQYEPDSMHAQARGKFADERRVSTNLLRVGLAVADSQHALDFFHGSLGVNDFIELLAPGATTRLYLEVPNMNRVIKTLHGRGLTNTSNIHDPDGTRIELVTAAR